MLPNNSGQFTAKKQDCLDTSSMTRNLKIPMNGPTGSFPHPCRAMKNTLLQTDHFPTTPKILLHCINLWMGSYAALSNFRQFYLHILWNGKENKAAKMSIHQHTLNQGWKCPEYARGKAQSSESHIRMITPVSKPDQGHSQSRALPSALLSQINRGDEARKSKEIISGQESIWKNPTAYDQL